jgi:hypothetical protein
MLGQRRGSPSTPAAWHDVPAPQAKESPFAPIGLSRTLFRELVAETTLSSAAADDLALAVARVAVHTGTGQTTIRWRRGDAAVEVEIAVGDEPASASLSEGEVLSGPVIRLIEGLVDDVRIVTKLGRSERSLVRLRMDRRPLGGRPEGP